MQPYSKLVKHLDSLSDITRWAIPSADQYQNFVMLSPPTTKYKHKLLRVQRKLETYRPNIEYLVLPNSDILVAFTEDFAELKRAALGLALADHVKQSKLYLQSQQQLLSACHIHQTYLPLHEQYPELYI